MRSQFSYNQITYSGSQESEICPMSYALCPMPYALCPMPYARRNMLLRKAIINIPNSPPAPTEFPIVLDLNVGKHYSDL